MGLYNGAFGVSGGAAAAFAPTDIAGLQAWFDASDASTFTYSSGTVVSQWNDKSGNNKHLTQGTVANQPTRSGTINSLASVVFDGNDGMSNASSSFVASRTTSCFVVAKLTNTAAQKSLFSSEAGQGNQFRTNSGTLETLKATVAVLYSGGTPTLNTASVIAQILTGTTVRHRIDAVEVSGSNSTTFAATTSFQLGNRGTGEGWVGDIAELLFYDTTLSAGNITAVEAYLKAKWGTP